jgi:DNA-binding transcriptional ArsR family regulator
MKTSPPAELQHLQTHVQAAAELLRVLANEHRLGVLCALRQGELSVGALLERVGPSQSALSQHLARLRQDGLVATRRTGQTIYYRIADDDVMGLLRALSEVMQRRRLTAP